MSENEILERARRRVENMPSRMFKSDYILNIIEENGCDLDKIHEYITRSIIETEKEIEEYERMSDDEFLQRNQFATLTRPYTIGSLTNYMTMLFNAIPYINSLATSSFIDYTIKRNFKGKIRKAKRVIGKLRRLSQNFKLDNVKSEGINQ